MLSDGKLVEFDAPKVLLSNDHSHFAALVEQTGAAEAEYLRTLANSSESSVKERQQRCVPDEESESDPLVPPLKLS